MDVVRDGDGVVWACVYCFAPTAPGVRYCCPEHNAAFRRATNDLEVVAGACIDAAPTVAVAADQVALW